MTYLTAAIVLLLFILLVFMPASKLLEIQENFSLRLKLLSVVYRGECLIEWLDNFGIESFGHDLGEKLPRKDTYKEFGQHIHKVWNSVQKRGGELAGPLRAIRLALRQDLKRTRREKSLLSSAMIQVIFMILLVWLFLLVFKYVAGLDLEGTFFIVIAAWQGFGFLAYYLWLKSYRASFLDPLDELLRLLLDMHFMFYRGALADAFLNTPRNFKARDQSLFLRMERTLDGWRKRGHGELAHVDELFEDFSNLSEDKAETFVAKLKISVFTWSVFFVLPPLFGSSLMGVSSLSF